MSAHPPIFLFHETKAPKGQRYDRMTTEQIDDLRKSGWVDTPKGFKTKAPAATKSGKGSGDAADIEKRVADGIAAALDDAKAVAYQRGWDDCKANAEKLAAEQGDDFTPPAAPVGDTDNNIGVSATMATLSDASAEDRKTMIDAMSVDDVRDILKGEEVSFHPNTGEEKLKAALLSYFEE